MTAEEKAQRLAAAIEIIDKHHDLGDAVYAVRSQYLCDWEDPRLTAYSNAVMELRALGVIGVVHSPDCDSFQSSSDVLAGIVKPCNCKGRD